MVSASDTRQTVNAALRDSAIRFAHQLERYKNAEIRKILALLNRDAYPALVEELQRRLSSMRTFGFDRGIQSTKRLTDMVEALNEMIREAHNRAEDKLVEDMHGFAATAAEVAKKQLVTAIPIEWNVTLPAPGMLRELVTSKPFAGELLGEHFDRLSTSMQGNLRRALNAGLTNGETFDKIAARVTGRRDQGFRIGVIPSSRREIKNLVGTAVQHVNASARAATYQENDDIVKGERWTATLDDRTCPRCWSLEEAKILYHVGEGPQPPAHLGPCRCARIPVLKSWRELGIDAEDVPKSTRASMDGQIPEDVTYGQWIKGQSAAVQDEALGPERAKLLRSGEVPFDKFTNDQGQLLTLAELRKTLGLD